MALYLGTPGQISSSGGRNSGVSGMDNNNPTYREVVLPEIAYVQNIQTPILASTGRYTVRSSYYEYVMGKIPDDSWDTTATQATDGEAESWVTDTTNDTLKYRVRAGNYASIKHRRFVVTDSERAQDEIGVADEYDQRGWEELTAFTLDWEAHIVWSRSTAPTAAPSNDPGEYMVQGTPYTPGGGGSNDRATHGLVAHAFDLGRTPTSAVNLNGTIIPGDQSATIKDGFTSTYYDGNSVDLTRDNLISQIMEPYWVKGGQLSRSLTFVGSKVKNLIDQFATIYAGSGSTLTASHLNERNIDASLRKVIDSVDIYTGTWGDMYVIKTHLFSSPNAYSNYGGSGVSITPNKTMLIFEPGYIDLAVKRPVKTVHLPKTGDFTAGVHVGELGVCVRNPRAMALGINLAV